VIACSTENPFTERWPIERAIWERRRQEQIRGQLYDLKPLPEGTDSLLPVVPGRLDEVTLFIVVLVRGSQDLGQDVDGTIQSDTVDDFSLDTVDLQGSPRSACNG